MELLALGDGVAGLERERESEQVKQLGCISSIFERERGAGEAIGLYQWHFGSFPSVFFLSRTIGTKLVPALVISDDFWVPNVGLCGIRAVLSHPNLLIPESNEAVEN